MATGRGISRLSLAVLVEFKPAAVGDRSRGTDDTSTTKARQRITLDGIFAFVTTTEAHEKKILRLKINGTPWEGAVDQQALLLDVLRYEAGLTGTKRGCDMGTCGCCAVQIEGEPRLSCLTLALDCQGANVRTIEGVQTGPLLTSLQEEWAACGASQCGFCTPGFIMVGEALIEKCPKPSEQQVREAIAGNLCRCTGYVKIVEAFMRATGQEDEPGRSDP